MSTTLMSKNRAFCSSQSWFSPSTPCILSHAVLKIETFPQPEEVQSSSSHHISFLRLALLPPSAPYLCFPLIASFIFLPHDAHCSLSLPFLFLSFLCNQQIPTQNKSPSVLSAVPTPWKSHLCCEQYNAFPWLSLPFISYAATHHYSYLPPPTH